LNADWLEICSLAFCQTLKIGIPTCAPFSLAQWKFQYRLIIAMIGQYQQYQFCPNGTVLPILPMQVLPK